MLRMLPACLLVLIGQTLIIAQDAPARLAPVPGPDEKPFAPEFPVGNLPGCDYIFTNPDADAAKAGLTGLWLLEKEALREVKTPDGKPARFEAANHYPVGEGLYVRGRAGKGADALWWVQGRVALPVVMDGDKPLPSGLITMTASGTPHALVAGALGAVVYRLEKSAATRVVSIGPDVAKANTIELHAAGADLLVSLDDGLAKPESIKLHRVQGGELKPVTVNGVPAAFGEMASRAAGEHLYVGARVAGQWLLFHHVQGALAPVLMPDGKPLATDIRFAQAFAGALQFDLSEGKDKPSAAWQVRAGVVTPLTTATGEPIKSKGITIMPMGDDMLVMAWDEGISVAHLWVHDGKAARPLTWADGKQVAGRQPFVAWQGTSFVLRLKDVETWEEKFYVGRDLKVTGPLAMAGGEPMTDQSFAICRGRTGVFLIDFRGKTYGVFRPTFGP